MFAFGATHTHLKNVAMFDKKKLLKSPNSWFFYLTS